MCALDGRADRDIYVELPEVTCANFWNVVIRDTWCGSDVGTELQHSVDQWRARKSTAFPTCFHIPTWWCSFFPGSPLPELIILKSPICTCYIHAPPRTQEIILVQFLNIIFLWCTNVRQKEINFHGGWVHSNIYDHLCTANPRKKWPMIVWGGMVLYYLWKRRYNDYNVEFAFRSDIRNKFNIFVPTRAQIAKHVFLAENIPAKGYKHICSASPALKLAWRGRGAGVKNIIQGAGPFSGWIPADDFQRLAPQEKSILNFSLGHHIATFINR